MNTFTFTFNPDKLMIESLQEGFNKWISKIERDKELYEVSIVPGNFHHPFYGRLVVKYKNRVLFYIDFYKGYERDKNTKRIFGTLQLRVADERKDILPIDQNLIIGVSLANSALYANYNCNQNVSIAKMLEDILPLKDQKKVDRIIEILDIPSEEIIFDTYEKRYVITSSIDMLKWQQDEQPYFFYKYMSLDVFYLMIENGTYRMNSIISQSDLTETFYLGDFLCDDYEDEIERFKGAISEMNILISSFTTSYDNAEMWYEYGDKGKGVCLGFQLIDNGTLHQVQYIDETTNLNDYKGKAAILKKEGIRIHYANIDNYHRFVKSDKYKKEKEWRLIHKYNGRLNLTQYGDRSAAYHDFKFEANKLKDIGIKLVSVDLGPCYTKENTPFPLLAVSTNSLWGSKIVVNRSRLTEADIKKIKMNTEKSF